MNSLRADGLTIRARTHKARLVSARLADVRLPQQPESVWGKSERAACADATLRPAITKAGLLGLSSAETTAPCGRPRRFGSHSGSRKSARRPSTRELRGRGLCEEERPMQRLGSDKCLGIGSSDTQAEGCMTWMIFLAAFNGTLFQPLHHLPTFQSAEACYNFIALLNYKGDEGTRLICVPR